MSHNEKEHRYYFLSEGGKLLELLSKKVTANNRPSWQILFAKLGFTLSTKRQKKD